MHGEIVLAALVLVVAILVAADFFRRTSDAPQEHPAGNEPGNEPGNEQGRIVSVGNFDIGQLAAALDFLRIALAPVVTSANERAVKLLQAPYSGLPAGLAALSGSRTTPWPNWPPPARPSRWRPARSRPTWNR